ncbi:MAG: hypothetical protein JWM09_1459 [Francisellaceae bacterium]|nr:hypothetical protein [Francisellaceae bacterium]
MNEKIINPEKEGFSINPIDNDKINQFIINYPYLSGELAIINENYVYLKIEDQIVITLFKLMNNLNFQLPKSFKEPPLIGAHISLIYENELKKLKTDKVIIGQKFDVKLDAFCKVTFHNKSYLIITVLSEAIAEFRKEQGLEHHLNYKGISIVPHLTIAKQTIF